MTQTPVPKPPTRPKRPAPPTPQKAAAPTPPAWQSPSLGLARPRPGAGPKVEGRAGLLGKHSSERGFSTDSSGAVNGVKSEVEHVVGAGAEGSISTESSSFDGSTLTETSTKVEGMAGATAAYKRVHVASDQELSVAIETLARAGAFGKAEQKAALQRGVLSLKESSSIEGNVGIEAKLASEAKVDRSGVIPALLVTLETGIKAGVWVDGQFDAEARVGPLALAVMAKISAMAGAEANFSGKAFANLSDGVGAEFEAGAFAGAKAHGEATAEVTLGPAALQITGELDAMAGAEAKVEGALAVSLTGVHAKFEAEAFAGAKASASGSATLKIRGKRIAYAKGTVEVYAGVGGKVKGEFEVKNGKIKFDFGAAAILGWGTGAEAEGEVDAGVLAGIIVAEINEMAASKDQKAVQTSSPDYVREKLDDQALAQKKEEAGYDALYDDFLAYANKKAIKGERGIKKEKVQAIIDRITPHIRAELAYVETDQGIVRAALDAFRGQVKHIDLQRGQIRSFQAVSAAEVTGFKERMQQEEKWRKARDGLAKDLDAYAVKKTTKGENGVKQQGVQQIISSHWKQLQSAFPGAEADEVVMFAAQAMKEGYLTKFTVKGGRIVEFEAPGVYAADAKKQAADTKTGAALTAALAQLDTGLATYRRTLLAKPSASFEQKQLEKVLRSSLSKVKGQLSDDAVNEQIAGRIRAGLAGIVDTVRLKNGAITVLGVKAGGLQAARAQQKTDEATQAHAAAAAEFGRRLAAYKEHKVGAGEHGMKAERAQKLLDEACAKVADWKVTPEAATELEAAAKEALGPFLKGIVINRGHLAMFDVDRGKMSAAKASRKADGKAVLDARDETGGPGQAEDNTRRAMVADALRTGLKAYASELRAAAEPSKKSPLALASRADRRTAGGPERTVTVVRLQKILDRGLKRVRADVNNSVGDAAIVDAVKLYLPMVKDLDVQGLRVTRLDVATTFFKDAQERNAASAAAVQAQLDIAGELQNTPGLSQPFVQAVLNRYRGKFAGLDDDATDDMLTMAVTNALTDRLEELEIRGGKVTKFKIKAAAGVGGK